MPEDSQVSATDEHVGEVVAIIPARGGSKGIPDKNLQRVGGRSLIARAVEQARAATLVDRVIVTTDSTTIANEATTHGAEIVERPAELAGDQASSESALLHVLERHARPARVIVFIQCTSPFVDPANLDRAIDLIRRQAADVAFSVVQSHGFIWAYDDDRLVGVNHDASFRERRQDRRAEYLETGGFYVLDARGFRDAGHRFFGRVVPVEVDPLTAIEIDSADDLSLANALATIIEGRR